jgi:pimeloyl-ACP methyl ester carboxylesterase
MAKTIIMIHGMMGGGWYWENYKTYFEGKGYNCITPTLRFHDMDPTGTPDPALGTTSLLDYAGDLIQEIEKLDERPIIMGHSMGGLLSQIVGSRVPAEALVLLTPASPAGINILKPSVVRTFFSTQLKWGFWRKPMRLTFKEATYSMLQLLTPEEQREIYDKYVYESGRAAFEMGFWFLDRRKASQVDESKITRPVLVIAGKLDRITPHSVVQKVAEKYKTISTYKLFDNHSHWVVSEPGWEEVADYVNNWLEQALPASK